MVPLSVAQYPNKGKWLEDDEHRRNVGTELATVASGVEAAQQACDSAVSDGDGRRSAHFFLFFCPYLFFLMKR